VNPFTGAMFSRILSGATGGLLAGQQMSYQNQLLLAQLARQRVREEQRQREWEANQAWRRMWMGRQLRRLGDRSSPGVPPYGPTSDDGPTAPPDVGGSAVQVGGGIPAALQQFLGSMPAPRGAPRRVRARPPWMWG